jgi:hypothetical protein
VSHDEWLDSQHYTDDRFHARRCLTSRSGACRVLTVDAAKTAYRLGSSEGIMVSTMKKLEDLITRAGELVTLSKQTPATR